MSRTTKSKAKKRDPLAPLHPSVAVALGRIEHKLRWGFEGEITLVIRDGEVAGLRWEPEAAQHEEQVEEVTVEVIGGPLDGTRIPDLAIVRLGPKRVRVEASSWNATHG